VVPHQRGANRGAPLRERTGDVPLLAHYYLKRYNERYGQHTRLTEEGLKVLQDCTWPGTSGSYST